MSRRPRRTGAPRHRLHTTRPGRRSATSALLLGFVVTAGLTTAAAAPGPDPQPAATADVTPPCPAYLGPQCSTAAHDRWAADQAAAAVSP
ncbi:MAG: hypothetical protein EKK42_02800 [Pseudonocardiaceae bacterium]|nr:MAG: hypothetical protein EKK42_02800 [Pseudonocardiaceae bacterium]